MTVNEFAENYAASGISRLHMPGHKGARIHGLEPLDLTEIKGADSLYEPNGVIARSEQKTARLFGARATCYSAEGSSLSIKAALAVVRQYLDRSITVAAPRNCHRAFINGCALLGVNVEWIYPETPSTLLCECAVTADSAARAIERSSADAVYITSPDYLGGMADIAAIAEVCRERGAFLICDNAHGAYLKFLGRSLHPLDLGADIVCDSAHKTLPVYTGGGYLHISKNAPAEFCDLAKPAMALFGSTSPSYLIMGSLDKCAGLLSKDLPERIRACCERVGGLKRLMSERGIKDLSAEPMKITVSAAGLGMSGTELAELMRSRKIECEYADPYAVVLMFSPYNTDTDFLRTEELIRGLEVKDFPTETPPPALPKTEAAVSIREAVLSKSRRIPVELSEGKICARSAMSCQPSVAVVMAGEKITAEAIKILKRYSIFEIDVL